MAKTKIEWTMRQRPDGSWMPGYTFNPWHGCQKVSPGCQHCYAETQSVRYGKDIWGPPSNTPRELRADKYWYGPPKWNAEAKALGEQHLVFCASMADVFEDHPQVAIPRSHLFNMIEATPQLEWLLLTKRPENIMGMLPDRWDRLPDNVWLGFSAESQEYLMQRWQHMRRVQARYKPKVTFISAEPLLGPLDLPLDMMPNICGCCDALIESRERGGMYLSCGCGICDTCIRMDHGTEHAERSRTNTCTGPHAVQWIIAGGESGTGARIMDLPWTRRIRDQAAQGGMAFFMKQLGSATAKAFGYAGKGVELDQIPIDLQIRQFPI